MTEFDGLKRSYISALHVGMATGANREQSKNGNEILHKFCEGLVENSQYSDEAKQAMKHELKMLKEVLSKEIEEFYTR